MNMWNERLCTEAVQNFVANVLFEDTDQITPNMVILSSIPSTFVCNVLYENKTGMLGEELPRSYKQEFGSNHFLVDINIKKWVYAFAFVDEWKYKITNVSYIGNTAHFYVSMEGDFGIGVTLDHTEQTDYPAVCVECGSPWPGVCWEDKPPLLIDSYKTEESTLEVWRCFECEQYFSRTIYHEVEPYEDQL